VLVEDTAMTTPSRTQTPAAPHSLTRYWWLLWILWLAFLVYPFNALYLDRPSAPRAVAVVVAAAVFAGVYAWNVIRNLRRIANGQERASPWRAIAILAAIALALTLGDRREWIELFIFVAVSMGPSLPPRQAVRAVGAVVLLMVVLGLAVGPTSLDTRIAQSAQAALQAAVSGLAVIIVVRTVVMERELRLARNEIARLAVSEERLRFARDLHDLLGHSLSLIALKSELAARLASAAPDRAATEMHDVQSVARTALQEVREAVAGYRQPTLESELQSAGEILEAAGVVFECDGEIAALPPVLEAALSWTVREGVTNVIRHSRAQRCAIRLTRDASHVGLEVIDDGLGEPHTAFQSAAERTGSGLKGLAERVAALHGRYDAGARADGGFRLAVSLPLTSEADYDGRKAASTRESAMGPA